MDKLNNSYPQFRLVQVTPILLYTFQSFQTIVTKQAW